MKMSRRTILKAGAGTALALAGSRLARGEEPGHDADPRHRVHRAAHDGARARARLKVTHFNRGKRDADSIETSSTATARASSSRCRAADRDVVVDDAGYIPKYTKC